MSRDFIIAHNPCSDGSACITIAKSKMPDANIIFLEHQNKDKVNTQSHDFNDANIYILDITLPTPNLLEILEVAKTIVIIDHHKTNKQDIENIEHPKLTKIFNMDKAGCQLTWEYFYPDQPIPWYFDYIGMRDIWKFDRLPNTEEVNEGMFHFGLTQYDKLKQLHESTQENKDLMRKVTEMAGSQFVNNKKQMVINTSKKAILCDLLDEKGEPFAQVWAIKNNNPTISNELGMYLSSSNHPCKIAALYSYDLETNELWISLRSDKSVDCSAVAKIFGGGGHAQASGATFHLSKKPIEQYIRFDKTNIVKFVPEQPQQPQS